MGPDWIECMACTSHGGKQLVVASPQIFKLDTIRDMAPYSEFRDQKRTAQGSESVCHDLCLGC